MLLFGVSRDVFNVYIILLNTGREFEVITSSSADVFKQEQVQLFSTCVTNHDIM